MAIRNGFLDIHGTPLNHTWTRLLSTAFAGSNVIYLRTFVNWPVGGTVVLSSSSATYTDVDKAVIIRLSAGTSGSIVTLDSNLNFTHSGAIETFNGATIDYGAEVALISRNIVVEGVLNNGHSQPLVNNYNDQFGGHVMMHPSPVSNGWQPHMRLSYVEFRHMGQAYQLGRYPVHYHMDPNVGARSYVNGCSIHDTFNRALTAHAVYNLTIKRNVAFNTMGHTFFVEDGIEEHNSFIENLGIMTHPSFSLLNTDQIPATFWITNPNNNYIGNVAAGSAGSGFFFNLQPNPTGPSFTPSICPRGRALGIFTNNTAHSSDFGFRIWEVYNPLSDPSGCWGNPLPVTFSNFIGYANRRGAEVSEGGAITLSKFAISDCYDMQMVWTEVDHPWGTAFGKFL